MAFTVKFNFTDALERKTSRSFHSTRALIADVIADVAVFAPLWNAVSEGGLQDVVITQTSEAAAFAASAGSNIDENASLKVLGADGFNYDFDLAMPIQVLRLIGGGIDLANIDLLALIAQFQGANAWRVNLRNPTQINTLVAGVLDK